MAFSMLPHISKEAILNEQYLRTVRAPETGELLSDVQILEMVKSRHIPEHNDLESENDTLNSEDGPDCTCQFAKLSEANPSYVDKHLTRPWPILVDIKQPSNHCFKQ